MYFEVSHDNHDQVAGVLNLMLANRSVNSHAAFNKIEAR